MCFSAEVSFASAAVLVPTGAYCLRAATVKARRWLPLALSPVMFAVQQAGEGVVWVALARGDATLADAAARWYLFFVLAVWPAWPALVAWSLETRPARARFLAGWTVLASGWFWIWYLPLLTTYDPGPRVVGHSVHYAYADMPHASLTKGLAVRSLYLATASVPLLVASERRRLGLLVVLAAVTAAVAVWMFEMVFTSVWCFQAAILSVCLVYLFARLPHAGAQRQSGA